MNTFITTTHLLVAAFLSCNSPCLATTCPNYAHFYDKISKIQTDAFCDQGEYCAEKWFSKDNTFAILGKAEPLSTCKPYASLVNSFDACFSESDYRNPSTQFNYPASILYKGSSIQPQFNKCACGTQLCDLGVHRLFQCNKCVRSYFQVFLSNVLFKKIFSSIAGY